MADAELLGSEVDKRLDKLGLRLIR